MKLSETTNENFHSEKQADLLPRNLICFSHLRWDFIFQRPQHILSRLSGSLNIFFIEEPVFETTEREYYTFSKRDKNLWAMVPHLPEGLKTDKIIELQKQLFSRFMENKATEDYIFWYYTPTAFQFSSDYEPHVIVYDCMDELLTTKSASPELLRAEAALMARADVVFTAGHSLYESKKDQHANIYSFPGSIDRSHFLKARQVNACPADQLDNGQPKLGFYGIIDERLDIELIKEIAEAKPDWQIILIGPIVDIDPDILPQNKNIQYLGAKSYQELPSYISAWDIALIPFRLNEATRLLSPTKTAEYLTAGLPVISTAIRDVINPYGKNQLVHIGANASDFVNAAERELISTSKEAWQLKADAFLVSNSWDKTCQEMLSIIAQSAYKNSYMAIAQ